MRKNFILCSLTWACLSANGQVIFRDLSFHDALKAAQAESKVVMVYAYTDWCGWCKAMDEHTFATEQCGNDLNDKAVSIKVDMERDFGVLLAMKHRVTFFPQYLFFAPSGQLIGRVGGYMKPDPFEARTRDLLLGHTTLPPLPQPMNYTEGWPEWYVSSFRKGSERKNPTAEEITAWLDTRTTYTDEITWGVLHRFVGGGPYGNVIIENRHALMAQYGKDEVLEKISSMLFNDVKLAIKERKPALLQAAIDAAAAIMGPDAAEYQRRYKLYYYQMVEAWEDYALLGEEMHRTLGSQAHYALNDIAWTLYQKCEALDPLFRARSWMKAVTEAEPTFMYVDTYAALLYKTGRPDEALVQAELALELGRQADEDVEGTLLLIEKIKGR
jgi:thiol-disulfide isomerase/thioredoxin